MGPRIRIVLATIVMACAVVLLWWQDRRRDHVVSRQTLIAEGTRAMKALNHADETFPDEAREQLSAVAAQAAIDPAAAGETLETKVVPMFDGYLVTIDDAIAAAQKVLAAQPDPDVARNVDLIRARATTMHGMRDKLAALRTKIAAGAGAEEIEQTLQQIGMEALVLSVAPPAAPSSAPAAPPPAVAP